MSEDINDLFKPVMSNGEVVNHELADYSLRVIDFRSSTFIQKEKVLVKGQFYNKKKSRNALLVFFDLGTGKVKGGTTFFLPLTIT